MSRGPSRKKKIPSQHVPAAHLTGLNQPKYNQKQAHRTRQKIQEVQKNWPDPVWFAFRMSSIFPLQLLQQAHLYQFRTALRPGNFPTSTCCVPRRQEYNPELFVLIPGQNQPLLVLKLKYVQTAFSFKA